MAAVPVDIRSRLDEIRADIRRCTLSAGRSPDDVELVAVSKTHPAEAIREAWEAGQRAFGESYAQELVAKMPALEGLSGIGVHFIGHLQTNKVKLVVGTVSLIHTVDRPSLVHALGVRAKDLGIVQNVLLEVHLSPEPSKSGASPESLPQLLSLIREYPSLCPRGLMTMPPYTEDPQGARPYFRALRELRDDLARTLELPGFRHLSMGMSHDYGIAIQEGATLVRIGTAIFGSRA